MPPYAGLDDAVDKCSGGNNGNPQPFHFWKHDLLDGGVAVSAGSASAWVSMWQYIGAPCHGSVPGAASNPTRATAGAIGQENATGGRTLFMSAMSAQMQGIGGPIYIADRLGHNGGLDATLTTPQAANVSAVRYTGAESVGNEIWLEIYTLIGATARNVTASYTNQDGTPGQVTPIVSIGGVGLQEPQRLIRLPLAAGDSGVQSVESVTVALSTGTAGNFGVTIMRTLAIMQTGGRQAQQRNKLGPDFPPVPIKEDACLFMYWGGVQAPGGSLSLLFTEA